MRWTLAGDKKLVAAWVTKSRLEGEGKERVAADKPTGPKGEWKESKEVGPAPSYVSDAPKPRLKWTRFERPIPTDPCPIQSGTLTEELPKPE